MPGNGDDGLVAIGIGDETLPCRLIITRRADYRAVTLIVAIIVPGQANKVSDVDIDLAIALLQGLDDHPCTHLDRKDTREVHGRYRGNRYSSIRGAVVAAFEELTADFGVSGGLDRKAWCVELRGYHGHPAHEPVSADPRPFYGLATGDEGWRFVPMAVAAERLGPYWGTRTFVAVYTMESGAVCLNNKGSDYIDRQHEFTQKHFGEAASYFALDSEVAGLDHGTLFVLERVLVRLAQADQSLHQAQPLTGPDMSKRSFNRNRLMRGSLDDLLLMLNSVLLPEVDSLERQVIIKMGVERMISRLDRQAQAIDKETRYAYESLVSRRVTRLTVLTIILTVVTIVLGALQVLVSL